MRYLILTVLMLAIIGCEREPRAQQDTAEVATPPQAVASGKTLGYLAKPLQGKVNQRGLYKLIRSGGLVDNPNTSTGKAISNPVIQLVKSTDRIPLIKGAQMQLQYRIWSLPDQPAYVDLRRVLKHPEMTLPDGSVSTGSDYLIKARVSVNQIIAYTGYGFDEDYEMVEGDWVFEIWHDDTKLIEQKFTTYQTDEDEIEALQDSNLTGR